MLRIRSLKSSASTRAETEEAVMNITLTLGPLMALIAGVLILIIPRLLNYIVAIYLIVIGLLGIFGHANLHVVRLI